MLGATKSECPEIVSSLMIRYNNNSYDDDEDVMVVIMIIIMIMMMIYTYMVTVLIVIITIIGPHQFCFECTVQPSAPELI